ncbi:MAG: urea ABC transporter permease subunit UrtB [Myxococcales bacterium]|nr:urea ABC transporter permease subunit UrtB [Myxococcales bacterium]
MPPLRWVWIAALALVPAVLWAYPRTARAAGGDFEAAVRVLCEPAPDAVIRGAQALVACGDPRGLPVLQALLEGELVVTDAGDVYVRGEDGELKNAVTGARPGPGPQRTPDLDNGVRRVLAPLIARLQIHAADAKVRAAGVEELARTGTDEDAQLLREVLEQEKQGEVRRAILSALAEHDLASASADRRLAAVKAIDESGSGRFRPTLQAIVTPQGDGTFSEPDARVRAAAASALRSLDRKQFLLGLVADLLYGLSTGSVLLLSALGLAITFGVMGVINMAHGEMLMIGAYATYVTQLVFRAHLPAHESLYVVAAVPVAFLACFTVGALLEVTVIRFLYGRPLETLLATYGLSLLLIQAVRSTFGAQNVAVATPAWLAGGKEIFEGVVIPYNRVAVILFAAVVVAFVSYLLRGTSLGLRVRAVTQNRPMAACMGISTGRVDTWTFALGSGVGGLGGVALAQLGNVGPDLGQSYIVDSFLVVVFGGAGSLIGTVASAFTISQARSTLEFFLSGSMAQVIVLMTVVAILMLRPQGLFVLKVRR